MGKGGFCIGRVARRGRSRLALTLAMALGMVAAWPVGSAAQGAPVAASAPDSTPLAGPASVPATAGSAASAADEREAQALRNLADPRAWVIGSLALLALATGSAGLMRLGGALARPTSEADTEGFSFRRHWGGLGGESTGWSASPRLVQLAVGGGLLLLALALLMGLLDATRPAAAAPAAAAAASAPAAAASGAAK